MNLHEGKWKSDKEFKRINLDNAAAIQEWQAEVIRDKNEKGPSQLISLASAMSSCMREVERIEKIEAMKRLNGGGDRIIMEWMPSILTEDE
ncbi:MAG: hypothetical protein ACYTFK_14235 [Planctomycetota bacterium]|jgi:hypothetical protein